ncbi:peroxin 20 [Coccidioides immitis RS]|uniref:Peroxin 20 n=4 Tax=Coccidioides immitis TaxID=5501 RepID=A0A0D8JXI7_COCIM|nr:peroxin 20 [Coccidioides immitis RS]KMP08485.1 hypothetical protein CIRG_08166 [Coccidioides immitis RMSCC 2394]KMU72259.1 hypothetical protein CISG_02908 [Coccidioides immitis RMSCC 3703]KMU87300.1 hypothetical protein CIHG_04745 [Coccidioides immitis H538.4]TPX20093.1 hypothetical protein DIZ76_017890 [Coccidioides immitis]KJF61621.1 peroxin 20 [Coccidioides immitis RS]
MADALCGPSNALQNFQKHASTDRTLQQDRISSRHTPTQGFRSRNPNEGTLDPEFHAFESGLSGPAVPDIHSPPVFHERGPALSPLNHHPQNSSWASDFQNLHISAPSPSVVQHRLQAQVAVHAPVSSSWHNEFINQAQPNLQNPIPQKQMMHSPMAHMPYQPMNTFGTNHSDQSHILESQNSQAVEVFDEVAFEAAFAEARAEVELQENKLQELENETLNEEISLEPIKIGSDTIPAQQAVTDEAEELARTAGQLLESVSHDKSQKFKESNFLALMRQLRDREVTVEGDEFRQAAQPLHPGGPYYPEQRKLSRRSDAEDSQNTFIHHDDTNTRPLSSNIKGARKISSETTCAVSAGEASNVFQGRLNSAADNSPLRGVWAPSLVNPRVGFPVPCLSPHCLESHDIII